MSIRCGNCKATHESVAQVRACYSARNSQPAAPGVYCHGGKIYRVVVKDSGRPFAEEYVNGAYCYAKGVVFKLRPEERLTLEQAKAWGRENVRCIRCGTKLEKESSREAGIGPVCATKI
jgi:hypothetical protein